VQKRKTDTQTKIFCITRVRLFSSSAQVWFQNTAIGVYGLSKSIILHFLLHS